MAESSAFTAHPLIEPTADPERFRRAFAFLRAEFQSETEPGKRAALAFELAKHHARLDETAHAAREALQATNLASGFVEPVEMLIAISREKNSRGNLRKLLERLERIATTPELRVRATLELCALCLAEGDADAARERAAAFLAEYGETSEHAGPFLLLLERLAAARGDARELARAARARVQLCSTPELRAEFLERASRAFDRGADADGALEVLFEAEAESASPRRRATLRRRLLAAGRFEEAREIARLDFERWKDVSTPEASLARAEALYELLATAPAAVTEEELEELLRTCRGSEPSPDLLLVALLGTFAKVRERTDLLIAALELAETCPLDDTDRGVLALARAFAERPLPVDRSTLARAARLLPAARIPRAALLLALARPSGKDPASSELNEELGALLGAPESVRLARLLEARLSAGKDAAGKDAAGTDAEASGDALRLALPEIPATERPRFAAHLDGTAGAPRTASPESALVSAIAHARAPSEDALEGLRGAGVGFLRLLFGAREPGAKELVDALTASERLDPTSEERGRRDVALARTLVEYLGAGSDESEAALLAHAESDAGDPLALGIGLALARENAPLRAARLLAEAASVSRARGSLETALDLAERALVAALERAHGDTDGRPSREAVDLAERALNVGGTDRHPLIGYLLSRILGRDGAPFRRQLAEKVEWSEAFRLRDALEGRSSDAPTNDAPRLLTVPLERVVSPEAARWLRALAAPSFDSNGTPVDAVSYLRDGPGRLPEAHLAFLAFRSALVARGGFSALEDGAFAREALPLVRLWKEAAEANVDGEGNAMALGEARLAWLTVALATGSEAEAERALDELLGAEAEARPDSAVESFRWASVELSATRRRAAETLGGDVDDERRLLLAYAHLSLGEALQALPLFADLAERNPNDPTILEGLRRAAERTGDRPRELAALTALAQTATDDAQAAALWEAAGALHLAPPPGAARNFVEAEECFAAALGRQPERVSCYAMLYRIVRARGDDARLIELLDARLESTTDAECLRELLWEKAQLCRKVGRRAALDRTLTRLLEDASEHLPALALAAELRLADGRRSEAAALLGKVARHPETGDGEREAAGLHALELFESLGLPEDAFELASTLLDLGVPEGKLRPHRARAAAQLGNWDLAYRVYRDLSDESDEVSVRSLASKAMLVLQRDHLGHPGALEDAARRVLRDAPMDAEAIDVVLEGTFSPGDRRFLLEPTLTDTKAKLAAQPLDATLLARYVAIATRSEIPEEVRLGVGLGALVSETVPAAAIEDARVFVPTRSLTEEERRSLLPPEWEQPTGRLLGRLGRALSPLSSPSLESLGLAISMRVDPFSNSALREELARLAGLFGLVDFELYVGGADPQRIAAFERDFPSLALGRSVRAPLDGVAATEAGLALFALRHGLAAFLGTSDEELLPWVRAFLAPTSDPERAARLPSDALPTTDEDTRALVEDFSRRGGLPEHILRLGRIALARALVFLHGDVSVLRRLSRVLPQDPEARLGVLSEAMRFSLSEDFLGLRRKAGLEP